MDDNSNDNSNQNGNQRAEIGIQVEMLERVEYNDGTHSHRPHVHQPHIVSIVNQYTPPGAIMPRVLLTRFCVVCGLLYYQEAMAG